MVGYYIYYITIANFTILTYFLDKGWNKQGLLIAFLNITITFCMLNTFLPTLVLKMNEEKMLAIQENS